LKRGSDHWESTARYVARLLRDQAARWVNIVAVGNDLSGEYVTVQLMNIPAVGPRIVLAPHADPGAGWLDLVLVPRTEQATLADAIETRGVELRGQFIPTRRVRRVELEWPAEGVHVDDEGSTAATPCHAKNAAVSLRGAVRLLVPD
jgi:hypothetical protein